MEIVTTPGAMRAWRRSAQDAVGCVPTMGYLHEGHLSLVRESKRENARTVVSIFVNPTQFGPGEDFEKYPRDAERDLSLLREAGVDAVYMPTPATIYPEGYQTYVTVEEVSQRLEGEARPGHFRGVATVVLKLLNAVEPDRAYFGRKDAQQLRVLQRMTKDLDLAVQIVPCPIVRESDGLAMSSRNVFLTPEQRNAAPILYAALNDARERFQHGVRDAATLRAVVRATISHAPLAKVEYVSVADDESLGELNGAIRCPALLSLVARFGNTRLLDNVELARRVPISR